MLLPFVPEALIRLFHLLSLCFPLFFFSPAFHQPHFKIFAMPRTEADRAARRAAAERALQTLKTQKSFGMHRNSRGRLIGSGFYGYVFAVESSESTHGEPLCVKIFSSNSRREAQAEFTNQTRASKEVRACSRAIVPRPLQLEQVASHYAILMTEVQDVQVGSSLAASCCAKDQFLSQGYGDAVRLGIFGQQYLSREARLGFFSNLCRAIEALWYRGLVHNDLHSGNLNVKILKDVNQRIVDVVPVILDFGLAIYWERHDFKYTFTDKYRQSTNVSVRALSAYNTTGYAITNIAYVSSPFTCTWLM